MNNLVHPAQSLLNEHQVAELLNVSVATIRRRRLLKQAPAPVRIGGCVRYEPAEIDRFVEASKSEAHANTEVK